MASKQPPEVFYKKRCSYKFHKIHRKTLFGKRLVLHRSYQLNIFLKVMSDIFLRVFLKLQKKCFFFTLKALSVLVIFKFWNFRILNFMTSSNVQTRNKKIVLLNNLGSKHSLAMKFDRFTFQNKRKTFIKNFAKNMTRKLVPDSFIIFINNKARSYIASFKGLRKNLYGFFLVILALGIRKKLKKCILKHKVWQKHKIFIKTFMGMFCFYIRKHYMSSLEVWHRA